MAFLCRKTLSGPGAEVLANKAERFLQRVEGLNFFDDHATNEMFKNAMSNRTVVLADGSVIQMRRGPINRVNAVAPAVPVKEGGEESTANLFLSLDIYDDTGATATGLLLFNLADLTKAPRYVAMTTVPGFSGKRDTEPGPLIAGDFERVMFYVPGVGYCRNLVSAFSSTHGVTTEIDDTYDDTGSAGNHIHKNYHRTTRIIDVATSTHRLADLVYDQIDSWDFDPGAPVDISGDASVANKDLGTFHRHMNTYGFTIKDVLDAAPFTVTPFYIYYTENGARDASGNLYSSPETHGWIDANNYFIALSKSSKTDAKTFVLNASTINGTYFGWSGEEQTLPSGSGYYSHSVMASVNTGINSVANDYQIPITSETITETISVMLYSNGLSWEITNYDAATHTFDFKSVDYYRYPGTRKVGIYVGVKSTFAGAPETFYLGVITNGVKQERTFTFTGDLVDFPTTSRFCYGDARIIAALAQDNTVRR